MEEEHFKNYYMNLISNMDKNSLALELSLIVSIKENVHYISNTSLGKQFTCMESCLNDEIWSRGINGTMDPLES